MLSRQYSSRMRTARFRWSPLDVVLVGVTILQVSSDDHQMPVVEGEEISGIWRRGRSYVWHGGRSQFIKGNGHIGTPTPALTLPTPIPHPSPSPEQNDRQISVKTLPSCNFACGR